MEWLEKLINRALAGDPRTAKRLKQLAGKRIRIHCTTLSFSTDILFLETGCRLLPLTSALPDTVISGPLSAFIAMALKQDLSAVKDQLTVSGDLEIAQEVQALFLNLQIDWEEPLSRIIGDVGTEEISKFFNKTRSKVKNLTSNFSESMEEYLKTEIQLTPSQTETNIFLEEVDHLRQRVDKLELKLQNVEKLKKHDSPKDEA